MNTPEISIFARWPTPGEAKTRLIPGYGAEGAAAVYRKLLEHTVAQARQSGLPFTLRTTGGDAADFKDWLGNDVRVIDQGEGDLTARLQRAPAPGMCIGSDCPGLTPDLLRAAADALLGAPVAIGPASDGGYWLVGFREPSPWLFDNISWSTDTVLAATKARCREHGIEPAILPTLSDVDEPDDLACWPEFQP